MRLSADFEDYHRRLYGGGYDAFLSALQGRPTRWALRVNTLKTSRDEVLELLRTRHVVTGEVPWCAEGVFVDDADLNWPEHQRGDYYVQDASSMLSTVVCDPKPGERVLDVCAAPGGKSTHLAARMENNGLLVANDQDTRRIRALVINLQRCGVANAVVSTRDGIGIEASMAGRFDRVLLDAPCSGVGTGQTNRDILASWSLDHVERIAIVQKKLIDSAYRCLKPSGILVYSTCTTTTEENEGVIEHLLETEPDAFLESHPVAGHFHPGLSKKTRDCIRVLPQDYDTLAYFTARIRKNG